MLNKVVIDPAKPVSLPDRYLTRNWSQGPASLLGGRKLGKGEQIETVLDTLYKAKAPTPERVQAADTRLRDLESRVAKLEQVQVVYRDVWQPGQVYKFNDQCTHAGALWICRSKTPTSDRPGYSSSWRLQTKTKDRHL
jgi:hypothetical protein